MARVERPKACSINGCRRRKVKGDLCYSHNRLKEQGLPLDTPIRSKQPRSCAVDGCEHPVHAKDLCAVHYRRMKKGAPIDAPFDARPKGPYRNAKGAKKPFEERLAARKRKAPFCGCGCGEPTEFSASKSDYFRYVRGHYRGWKPYKDEKWLEENYVRQSRTIDAIAKECGVVASSVAHYLRRFGIPIREQKESLRLSGAVKGRKNPAWKGGTTPERQRLYKTPEWRQLVLAVWTRDGFKCQRCGVPSAGGRRTNLHAHHIGTWAEYPELRTDMKNLVTLCKDCHLWVHSNQNRYRRFLKKGSRRNKHDTPPSPRK